VEAADEHADAGRSKLAGQIHGARELIRLHAHQRHDDLVRAALQLADPCHRHVIHVLVDQMHVDAHILPQEVLGDHVLGQAGETRQSVAREHAAQMAHHVPVVVVLRGFDQIEVNSLRHALIPCRPGPNYEKPPGHSPPDPISFTLCVQTRLLKRACPADTRLDTGK
jgi:hypothetical protein